jgi:nitrogen regulatory protein P-II 1
LTHFFRFGNVLSNTLKCEDFQEGALPRLESGERPFLFVKKIECCVQESEIQPLLGALLKTGIGGVTVYPVEGKMKRVEVVALDIETDYVVGTILEVMQRNKRVGDDQIAIFPVEDVIRIRTGEKGAKAVY